MGPGVRLWIGVGRSLLLLEKSNAKINVKNRYFSGSRRKWLPIHPFLMHPRGAFSEHSAVTADSFGNEQHFEIKSAMPCIQSNKHVKKKIPPTPPCPPTAPHTRVCKYHMSV